MKVMIRKLTQTQMIVIGYALTDLQLHFRMPFLQPRRRPA